MPGTHVEEARRRRDRILAHWQLASLTPTELVAIDGLDDQDGARVSSPGEHSIGA